LPRPICPCPAQIIFYGVGSTVGAGIFVITGQGALSAGPAVVVSFALAALCCLFSAFSYAEFAARVPVSGSAYTFTYVCVGELAAWFVGWNLTLEYV
jgi:APA family basic amino acid/polyamine antiporter